MQDALSIARPRKFVKAIYGQQVLSEAGWLKLWILAPPIVSFAFGCRMVTARQLRTRND